MQFLTDFPTLIITFRIFLISFLFNIGFMYFLCCLYPDQRYPRLFIFSTTVRFLLDFFMTNFYFLYTDSDDYVWYLLCVFMLLIILLLIYQLSFRCSLTHALCALVGAEVLVCLPGWSSVVLVNILEGRDSLSAYAVPFTLPDLLLVVLIPAAVVVFSKLLNKVLRFYRNYRFSHPGMITFFVLFYSAYSFYQRTGNDISQVPVYHVFLFATVLFSVFLLLPTRANLKSARTKQALLIDQRKLGESYLTDAREQIYNLKQTQDLIDSQIEKIVQMDSAMDTVSLSSYLEELKQHYQRIQSGMYSQVWMLDAAFSSHAEEFREKQIDFDGSTVGYRAGTVDEWDLVRFLLFIVEYGIQLNEMVTADRRLSLHVSTVKNAAIIDFSSSWDGISPIQKNLFDEYLKPYNGYCKIDREKTSLRIVFSLLA